MLKHSNVIEQYIKAMINNSIIIYKHQEYNSQWIASAINHVKNTLKAYCNNSNIALLFCDPLKYTIAILAFMDLNLEVYLLHPTAPKEKIEHLKDKGIDIVSDQYIDLSNIKIINTSVDLNANCNFIFSTSNTTSNLIRWVEIPSKTLLTKAYMLRDVLEIKETDCTYIVSPMCFIQTIWTLLVHFISSSKIWLDDFSVENLKKVFSKNLITTMVTVPSIAQTICDTIDDATSLRLMVLGGDFAKDELIYSLKSLNDYLLISNVYGCTETSAADIILPPTRITDNDRAVFSLGKPSCFSEITLIDGNGKIVEESNKIAQVYINGEYVAKKYYDSDMIICNENGFATGDFAYRDKNGYYYFVGRRSTIIKYNGQKIYAFEVENALMQLDGILEAVVYGKSDDKYGQIANAIITITNSLTKAQIVNDLRRKLERYKIPKNFYYVESIPKTITGKTIRNNQIYDELEKIIIN